MVLPELPTGLKYRGNRGYTEASLEVRQVGRRAVSQLAGRGMGDEVVIIHFNDVYNIEQTTNTEPVGGALRFSTAVKALQHLNPLVLFSGDVFSPSMYFGLEVLSGLVAQCNFPWLMSNVIDNETGRPLGDGKITHALMCNGHKIGFIGLVEQGCEYVIALTHMRTPNDIKLAEGCNDIDLILGGHDHVYEVLHINNKYVVKSGTDFRQFSKISISFAEEAMIEGKMDEVLGKICVPLEGRFSCIRRQECNLGNWVCDVLLAATGADLVLLNSGTFRSDQVHAAGDFTLRDLSTIIPMRDPLVVVEATGEVILQVLENSVSKYPSLEGRFPQVAGVSFAFDPSKPPGQRVAEQVVKIGDEYLQKEQVYRLAVKQYLYSGNDGLTRRASLDDLEQQSCELAPKLENRIIILNKPEELQALIAERTRWESDTVIREVDDEGSP
ncbi:hypothetical protein HF086_008471 [Spodoptera exigua]|uniref:5'-Nucleotidase C-terminal domain-containing protein n=1 Tax=Spodoptera exigua TaxID=7107 RepID=A0A922SCV8_SPOEX|nr:hypothetical protein HF086_008471 [Spodoptera exigua]